MRKSKTTTTTTTIKRNLYLQSFFFSIIGMENSSYGKVETNDQKYQNYCEGESPKKQNALFTLHGESNAMTIFHLKSQQM